jgi:hypothetical protein
MEFEVATVLPETAPRPAIKGDNVSPAAIERALIVAVICAFVSATALSFRHGVILLIHTVQVVFHNTPGN